MSASGSYNLSASDSRAQQAEIERLAAQARSGWHKEARLLSWFGVQDGMSLLEPGSGPGFISEQLATLFPSSPITCLEIDPMLLEQARHYLHDKNIRHVHLLAGSVMDMRLDAEQFDCVYARFLFQHLPDPARAASEIWRVLKPGGKLIIHDIDDDLFGMFAPPFPEFAPVLSAFGQAQAARGGNRHIGQQLWRILNDTGFRKIDMEVIAEHSGEKGVEPFLRHIDPERMRSLVEAGFLSELEFDQFRTALATFAASPEAYTIWLSLMVCAEKA